MYDAKKKGLSPIPLVSLIFQAKTEGSTYFSFESSKILKNDGLGTPLPHTEFSTEVIIKHNPAFIEPLTEPVASEEAPKAFPTFWLIILIISGLLGYKLLKLRT